ncbi:hypothetical protein [Kiloniella sp.]|uniref:hypothetical protein n=1 Tax=Kiloniella sp. TaxID=1938587 RepID=UPI003A91C382
MTTLKDFVKAALSDVTEALLEFDQEGRNRERGITPFPIIGEPTETGVGEYFTGRAFDRDEDGVMIIKRGQKTRFVPHIVMPMQFDVAITASSQEGVAGGVSIKVLEFVKIGADVKVEEANSTVSRVSFKVPLQLARSE